jgi:hypothetical protein
VRTVAPDGLAGDPDADDAVRGPAGVVIRGRVDEALRVEEHEVRPEPRRDAAAVGEPEERGGTRRQPCDRLVDRQEPVPHRVAPEEPGGRPPESRVRPWAEDPVRADELEPVTRNLADGVLPGVVEDHRHVEPRGAEQLERGVNPCLQLFVTSQLGERLAGRVGVWRRGGRDRDPVRTERPEEVLPPGKPVRDVPRNAGTVSGSVEPLKRRVGAALLRPAREDAREQRAPGAVGVLVEAEVDVGARPVEQVEERADHALVGERLEMRQVERRARPPRDLEHFLDRVEQAGAFVADVRDDRHPRERRFLGEGDELVGAGMGAGEVDEAEGEHPRSRLERRAHVRPHLGELRPRRRRVVGADDDVPDRPVRGRGDQRRRRFRGVERLEVLVDGLPLPLLRPGTFERLEVVAPVAPALTGYGRGSEPVGADHLGRESLRDLRHLQWVGKGRERRVGVEVDESRAEHQAPCVDVRCAPWRAFLVTLCHMRDPPFGDRDVADEGHPGTGVHRRAAEHQRARHLG